MILRLLCPSGHVLDVDAQLAGRKIRCGACGAIIVAPLPSTGPRQKPPPQKPALRPPVKPPAAPPAKPDTKPIAKLPVGPPAKPVVKPQVAPPLKPPTADLAPAAAPSLHREPGMVAVPLPPIVEPSNAAAPPAEAAMRRPRRGLAITAWLRKLWPPADSHLPDNVTIPGKTERRTALQLAALLAVAALLDLLPIIGLRHADLRFAPPWALAAVFLAVLQFVYALWMINAPDWVSARVQMMVSALATTIYGMVMTLTMIMPVNRALILGLGEVRRSAPAWCGLMFLFMGAATWFCGRTSTRWRRSLTPPSKE